MTDWLLVLAGGVIGAPVRYLTGVAVKARVHSVFPYGTLAANAAACLLLGFLSQGAADGRLGPNTHLLLATGFCGALSTWSTFAYETATLALDRRTGVATGYLVVTLGVGIGLAYAGAAIADALG
ncbi:fluoride efflux transporter FluC [Kitasatospora sp. NPDC056327]|uniref:fluoride efflux transporter FluC n=1 Tax=Kitasatospora sp. NPDC056327 TaxID=3345785 RepID=UPI0035E0BB18